MKNLSHCVRDATGRNAHPYKIPMPTYKLPGFVSFRLVEGDICLSNVHRNGQIKFICDNQVAKLLLISGYRKD